MPAVHRVLLAALIAVAIVSDPARAADPAFYTATYIEVAPPEAARAVGWLRDYREASGKEAGRTRTEILQRLDRPNQFVILGVWADQKAFEAHVAGPNVRALREKLEPVLLSPNDERLHRGLAVGAAPNAPAGALWVVTHVDVIPPRKDDGLALLVQL